MAKAVLENAFNDLRSILNNEPILGEDELSPEGRLLLFAETRDWFLLYQPAPYSFSTICEILNLDQDAVRAVVRRYIANNAILRIGRRIKLGPVDIVEIRRALGQGASTRELARKYGVDQSHIRRIRLGYQWRHVGASSSASTANQDTATRRKTATSTAIR